MKKLLLLLVLVALQITVSCNILKDLNNVTVCSEVGLYVDVTKDGHYRINGKKEFNGKLVTRKVADSLCFQISKR